jgi:methylene-tetrahydromethanopterin dehydrogenase
MVYTSIEFSRIEGKKVKLVLIEPEFPMDFDLKKSLTERKRKTISNNYEIKAYKEQLQTILKKAQKTSQATLLFMERGLSDKIGKNQEQIEFLAQSVGIPFFYVDLPTEFLESQVLKLKNQLDFIQKLKKTKEGMQTQEKFEIELQNLSVLLQNAKNKFQRDYAELLETKRPTWILFQIVELLREWESKDITCFLIISKINHEYIQMLATQLELQTEQFLVQKTLTEDVNTTNYITAIENQNLVQLEIQKEKQKAEKKYLLYMVDTDPIATPYDITMAYDSGYDAVIHFEDVKPEETIGLIQDLVFSRRNNKYTTLFLNGRHENVFFEVLERVKKSMFGPFKVSVVIDPRGACSGAAAAVALIEDCIYSHRMGRIEDKKVVIFGGTGPFGHLIATLLYKDGCDVTIVETWKKHDQKFLNNFLEYTKNTFHVHLKGGLAFDETSKFQLAQDADIIISTAAPGIQILTKSIMKKLPKGKLAIDTNMVAPSGIEGITGDMDGQEIYPGIFGIGAITIGAIKYKVEMKMLKDAKEAKSGFFDLYYAVKAAKRILHLPEKKNRIVERT